ncbi:MAG: SH3 domain-containing protein [Romboutsia sp.]
MNLKRKSIAVGLISASIIIPSATGISFANGIEGLNVKTNSVDYRNITGNSVNFRQGPGTNYDSMGKLNKGDQVEYIDTAGSWVKIKHNGTEGFVHGDYISGSSGGTDTTVKEQKQVTASSVNFRTGAGTNYSVIRTLSKGTQVGYISESNGWAKINYNGTIGYISAQYLGDIDSGGGDAVASNKEVTGSSVNFRQGPGTNYSVIRTLSKGTQVGYISESNGWAKINYNGTIGYISAQYLGDIDSGGGDAVASNKEVTGSSVNFRQGPGTNYSVIRTLSKGTQVGYISESNGWAKVNYNGTIGYMSAQYLGDIDSGGGDIGQGADAVIDLGMQQLGKPYVWGAEGPNSFDCSGFTQYVFKNAASVNLPRVSRDQSRFGQAVSKSNLQKGDLIFFDTDKDGSVNHVGIYMGNNEFIHASSGAGKVVISQFNNYYNSAYTNARRVL